MKITTLAVAAIATSVLFVSCKKDKKDDNSSTPTTDSVVVKFEHTWADTIDFALNTEFVHPTTGDSLTFTTFKFYVSNIKLKKADGTWWSQPDSYHLLDMTSGGTPEITLTNVPVAEYTDIEYTLGVDSTKNVSGAQSGDLSPSLGMFWSWNSGYIMVKAEGTSPQANMGSFSYHLGGFSGANNIVTTKMHNFGANSLSVKGNGNCQIHLHAAAESFWNTIGSSSGVSMVHMPGSSAVTIANDYYGSFEFEHIHE